MSLNSRPPDINEPEKLKAWLVEHNHLSTYDLVLLTKRSPSTIRNWKRRHGVAMNPSPFASAKHINKPKDVETINDPAIWDNPEWFRRKYHEEGIGTPTIARIINRSIVLVVGRLRRYGISLRHHSEAVKSRSIHCSREWLHEQYYVKKQSLKECAGMAGVSPYTIYNWLVKFGMEPRTMHQAMAGEMNPFHGRKHTEETKNKIREALRQKKKSATNVSPP